MKFRGKLTDLACIQNFTKIVNTVSKLAKVVAVRILPSTIYFILRENVSSGGICLWCELLQEHFFNEYNMEGVSAESNEIFLELATENLVNSLKSCQTAKSVKIKLTKKHVPCLTLEVELPSLQSHSRVVIHDVPVSVVPRRLWNEFQEPEIPQFDLTICMPSIKIVKNVVERMKNLSSHVILSANQDGEISLKVETDMVTVTTYFKDLEIPVQALTQNQREPIPWAEARVDIRKLSQFLFAQQMNPTRVICNILHGKMVHLFLLHDDVTLQFFLPSIAA